MSRKMKVRLPGPAGNYDCDEVFFDLKTHRRVALKTTRVDIA